jgi:hypothetical protein
LIVILALLAALAGCGDDEPAATTSARPPDRPAKPPEGWKTVVNEKAQVSIAAPRRWRVTERARATLIRSPDRTVAVTLVADRSPAGAETPAADYARDTLTSLPNFEGSVAADPRRVRGSPYPSAQVEGRGRLPRAKAEQLITVAAFHRARRDVTYAVVAFRQIQTPGSTVERMLGTVRGG